jgi:hypothetical protein
MRPEGLLMARKKAGLDQVHMTTICCLQAEAILKTGGAVNWINKSVLGLAVVEFWAVDPEDQWKDSGAGQL